MAMAATLRLEDSPMFHKQVNILEESTTELKGRCQRLYKGSQKFMTALGEAFAGDTAFADSLEAFGGGQDDATSMSIGGPIMSKFVSAFRELATYKELLRSQVEHVLVDRLVQFMTVDMHEAMESRRRFDKASHAYDQAREKFVSLRKSTRDDIVDELEEDLQNSKSAFERSRFTLVNALMKIESRKKHEFLESLSAIMDAHLKYFKLGYELLRQMEPLIHEVLTYAQKSKELANIEQDELAKRIQEFRTQVEIDTLRASTNMEASTSADGVPVGGMASDKKIEAIMQSTSKGEVQTIKQGYLLKRSSSLRGDCKRRFFVLDSLGTLYYYRSNGVKPMGSVIHRRAGSFDHNGGMFGRFRSRQSRGTLTDAENMGIHIVDLHTSTIKIDAEDKDLRLCFRIISPSKTYTLQAESGADMMDWVNKLGGVIASLLNSQILQLSGARALEYRKPTGAESSDDRELDSLKYFDEMKANEADHVSRVLRGFPGNDLCAECSTPHPDWASLNLGIVLCIGCSGIHRNLGVHISKVRSMKLDVKVWEPIILDLFRSLSNTYCNSIWEELLPLQNEKRDDSTASSQHITKPSPNDGTSVKEKFIQAKYVEKVFVKRASTVSGISLHSSIWKAVEANNLQEVYGLIVKSEIDIINTSYDQAVGINLHHQVERNEQQFSCHRVEAEQHDPRACTIASSGDPDNCHQGCSLLHLACDLGDHVMVELLLQFGADINMCDFHGRTPLHHCIFKGNNQLAKYLLKRGARPSIKDSGGLTSLERAMEMGAISDDELFILLAGSQ